MADALVRSVNEAHVGLEFCALDDHEKKMIGFYLMPKSSAPKLIECCIEAIIAHSS